MSEERCHVGKIRKVELGDLTIEEWYKQKCQSLNIQLGELYKTYQDALSCEVYPPVIFIINDDLWEIVKDEEKEPEYISVFLPNNDGTYDYVIQFNSGGTCFTEMIEDIIERINNENNVKHTVDS